MRRLAAVAIALAALPAATARAAWAPEPVPGGGDALELTSFEFDASGRGLLLFEGFREAPAPRRFTGVLARGADGTWRRASDLEGITWGDAHVHPYASGRMLLVASRAFARARFNRRRMEAVTARGGSDGSFARARALGRDVNRPVAAVGPSGAGAVGWTAAPEGVVRVARRSTSGRFGRPRSLSRRGAVLADVAVNARGDLVAAWLRRGRVEARVRRAGRDWGPVERVARPALTPSVLQAAVSPSGRVLLAWGASTFRSEEGPLILEHGFALRHRGGWHARRLDRFTRERFLDIPAAFPRFDTRGRALVAWAGDLAGAGSIRLVRVSLERVESLARFPYAGDAPLDGFEVSPTGALGLAWSQLEGTAGPFVTTAPDGFAFSPPADLHEPGTSSLGGAVLGFAGPRATVAWAAATSAPGGRPAVRAASESP